GLVESLRLAHACISILQDLQALIDDCANARLGQRLAVQDEPFRGEFNHYVTEVMIGGFVVEVTFDFHLSDSIYPVRNCIGEPNAWRLYIHVKPHLFTKCYNRIAPFSPPVPVWALSSHPGRACDSWPMPPSHPIPACTGKTGPSQSRRSQKAFSRVGGGKCTNPSLANFVGVLMYGAPPYTAQSAGCRVCRIVVHGG